MNFKIDKRFFLLCTNIILIFISYILVYCFLYNDICTEHDSFWIYEYLNDMKIYFSHGRFFSKAIVCLFYHIIPNYLNIHPNNVANSLVPFFSATAISITTILCLKILTFFKKEEKSILLQKTFSFLYLPMFIIMAIIPLTLVELDIFYFSSIAETIRYYDEVSNIILFVFLFYSIIKILYGRKITTTEMALYTTNAFLVGISFEMITLIGLGFSILSILYCLFLFTKKIVSKEQLFQITLITLSMIISTVFLCLVTDYHKLEVTAYNAPLIQEIEIIFANFLLFKEKLINIIFLEHKFLLASCIVLLGSILAIKKPNESVQRVIFLTLTILSLCIFFFIGLVVPGQCEVYNFNYWGEHFAFRALYFKIIFALFLFLYGYLIYKFESKKWMVVTLLTVLGIYSYSLPIINREQIKYEYNYQIQTMKELRKTKYNADEISMFYNKYDNIVILPISYYKNFSQHKSVFRQKCYDSLEYIRNAMIKLSEEEIKQGKTRLFTFKYDAELNSENDYINYLSDVYKKRIDGLIFVEDDIAIKELSRRNFKLLNKKTFNFTEILRNSNKTLSIDELNRLIEEDNSKDFLYMARSRYYWQNENYAKALIDCSKAIELQTTNSDFNHYYWQRAQIAYKMKNYDLAKNDLINLLKKTESFEARRMLAELYEKENNLQKAIDTYISLLEIFPYYTEQGEALSYHYDISRLCFENKNYLDAIKYTKIGKERNEAATIYLYSAKANIELKNWEEALEDIELGLKYNSNLYDEYNELKQSIENKK